MLNLVDSAYVYDARRDDNPIETCFLHDDGPARRRRIGRREAAGEDNVLWGALFEEPRRMGDIVVRLAEPMAQFGDFLAMQYAVPGVEWLNSKCYTWYQCHYEEYPLYPETPDDSTLIYRAASVRTCGLRLVRHRRNFPLSFDKVPPFSVTVAGGSSLKYTLWAEGGLWGRAGGLAFESCYNGVVSAHDEGGRLRLEVEAAAESGGPDRTVITLRAGGGRFSFLPAQCLEKGYMAVPDFGALIWSREPPAQARVEPLRGETVRERVRKAPFRTFGDTLRDIGLRPVQPMPGKSDSFARYDSDTVLLLPDDRMTEHWRIGLSHLMAFCSRMENGQWDVKIGPYPMFGTESAPIIRMLEIYGREDVVSGALDVFLDSAGKTRPEGEYLLSDGCLNIGYGILPGDCWIPYEPGYILLCLAEHYFLSRDREWLERAADRMLACVEWVFREIDGWKAPGALDRGLLSPTRMGDISDVDVYFVGDAATYMGVRYALLALRELKDGRAGRWLPRLEEYRQDIRRAYRAALERAPVVELRNGAFAPGFVTKSYLRGWMYEIWPQSPVNALRGAWLDVDHAVKLIEAGVFAPDEPETRWALDAFEDNLALNDFILPKKWDRIDKDPVTGSRDATFRQTDYDPERDWFAWGGTGWQNGYCPLMQCYLASGERKAYVRSFYNTYAIHADPDTFWLREHGASLRYPIKTFEEGWMLWRLRAMLVWDTPEGLRLCRATPDEWYRQGFEVRNMPTYFGKLTMRCAGGRMDIELVPTAEPEFVELTGPGGTVRRLEPGRMRWTVEL